jgi:hypothetical protein
VKQTHVAGFSSSVGQPFGVVGDLRMSTTVTEEVSQNNDFFIQKITKNV